MIIGWSFIFTTIWLYDWHWIRIFGWIIPGTSNRIPNWLSKYWSWSACNNTVRTSWAVVCLWRGIGVGIYCVLTYGAFITSKTNPVRCYQLMELLTLSCSTTWLIPTPGGRWGASELASNVSTNFTLGMNEDWSILTAEILDWVKLLVHLVVWDSPGLGVWVNLLQDSSRGVIAYDPVGFWLVSELGSPLGVLLYSKTFPPIGIHLIMDIPPG